MEYYNNNPIITKTQEIQQELELFKEQMRKNIFMVVDERGEKLNVLLDETEQLEQTSYKFEKKARGLKWSLIFKVLVQL